MFIDVRGQTMASKPNSDGSEVCRHLLDGRPFFQAYLRRRLGSREEAEDVFQDFSLKAIRAARTLDKGEKTDAWLGRVLRNTLIDHYRRRAVRHRAETAYAQETQSDIADVLTDRRQEPCQCIHAALPRLRPDYAEILRRADLEEEPRDNIAAALGTTTNNINVRLHRARLALKEELQRSCPDCRNDGYLKCAC
jgi:RNA polymerase sigma-70 factor, ECF subfamily